MDSSNKRTSVVSIRIPDKVREELENESVLNNITLNANVSKILQRHTEWDMYMQDTNFVYCPKAFLKELLDNIDKKKCRKDCRKNLCQTV